MKITDRLIPEDRRRVSRIDTATAQPIDRTASQDETFTRAVSEASGRQGERPALAERLDALAGPAAGGARSYDNERSIELLQHVIDSVLPSLDADDESVSLAREVIGEELDWRQAWGSRMTEAPASLASDDFNEESPS